MSSDHSPAQHAALDARFEIIRELGRGGTALVYLARERSTGAEVAIKLIRSKYIEDDEAVARFDREARFVAQLDHPNIVPVRSVLDLGSSGMALVMAHVDGRTLRQIIRADGRLSPARTEQVLRDIGSALGAAHAKGIIHRDVKPENIFIDADGRAMLADFGLARSMTADTQLTMSGIAIGTPAYMAPEQIEGGELDARADVYSLGLVAWEMLSGHRPWDGQSLYSVLYHQKHETLPDVRDLRDDVPDRLAEVIIRAIEKDREARWPNMRSLLDGLDDSTTPQLLPRRVPVSAQTTRFVRPATPVTALVFEPPLAPPANFTETQQALRDIADELEGKTRSRGLRRLAVSFAPPHSGGARHWVCSRRRCDYVRRYARLAAARCRGVSQWIAALPMVPADGPKPILMGAPIEPTAIADTTHRAATDATSPANRVVPNTAAAPDRATVAVVPPQAILKSNPAPATPSVTADSLARARATRTNRMVSNGALSQPTPPASTAPAPAPARWSISAHRGHEHRRGGNA